MTLTANRAILENLYSKYNRRVYVHPDPLEFLYDYDDPCDREIVGLIASSLAYGKVAQILKSVSIVLGRMPSPSAFLGAASRESLDEVFADFRHRFTSGENLSAMLYGAKRVIEKHGSLRGCFVRNLRDDDDTVIPALSAFVDELTTATDGGPGHLLPSPRRGSACKRLNLFLRWMVRHDDVDPGGWHDVPASKLIVPLDTHMHRTCIALGLTRRKQANMRAATEATAAFRTISLADPVRYDFALTRLGIRRDADLDDFLGQCRTEYAAQHA